MVRPTESYSELIGRSYGYSSWEQTNSPAWTVVRTLYENNYVLTQGGEDKIPKKIHQIWLGSKVPDKYRKYMDSWQRFNPTWEYKLWTDESGDALMKGNQIYGHSLNQGMKSDILRYQILRREGGLYADTDFECLKSFDDLLYLDFFTGISYDAALVLYIGLIASVPEHPIIVKCNTSIDPTYRGNDGMGIMNTTGPYYFTRCFISSVTKDTKGVVAFPMDFFYPLSNAPHNVRGCANPYNHVKPFSYAIHHWMVSWMK